MKGSAASSEETLRASANMGLDRTGASLAVGIFVLMHAEAARADAVPCLQLSVAATESLVARWPGLADHVREAFGARDDVDRCARVELDRHATSIAVTVTLPDGRATTRSVLGPADVAAILEALLIVPPVERALEAETSPTDQRKAVAADVAGATDHTTGHAPEHATRVERLRGDVAPAADDVPPQFRPVRGSSHFRIDLSVLTGVRAGDGQMSVGAGAVSLLDLSGWLLGFEGRGDRYRMLSGADSGAALELAILLGRRFRFGSVALDVTTGGAAALQGTASYVVRGTMAPNSVVEASNSSTVPRWLVGMRASFGALATVCPFFGIDGELGPARNGGDGIPNASRLPIWTLGFAIGATVGVP